MHRWLEVTNIQDDSGGKVKIFDVIVLVTGRKKHCMKVCRIPNGYRDGAV
jgi:hypothetical protein